MMNMNLTVLLEVIYDPAREEKFAMLFRVQSQVLLNMYDFLQTQC